MTSAYVFLVGSEEAAETPLASELRRVLKENESRYGYVLREVHTVQDVMSYVPELRDSSLVVLFILSQGAAPIVYRIATLKKPVLLVALEKRASFAEVLGIAASLRERGFRQQRIVVLHAPSSLGPLTNYLVAAKYVKRFKGIRIALLGRHSGPESSIDLHYDHLLTTLDAELRVHNVGHIMSLYRKVRSEEVKDMVASMLKIPRRNVSPGTIDKGCRLYHALRTFADSTRSSALAVSCSEFEELPIHLALSLLAIDKIPAICGNDVPALFSAVILQTLTETPVAIAKPVNVGSEEVIVASPSPPLIGSMYYSFVMTSEGPKVAMVPGEGELVTLFRISGDLKTMHIIEGRTAKMLESVESPDPTTLRIRTNRDPGFLLEEPLGANYAMAYGWLGDQLEAIKLILGVEKVLRA